MTTSLERAATASRCACAGSIEKVYGTAAGRLIQRSAGVSERARAFLRLGGISTVPLADAAASSRSAIELEVLAGGGLDSHFGSADLVRSADHVAEAADDARRLVAPEVGAHEQELVLGELTEPVGLTPHAQCPRCRLPRRSFAARVAVRDGRDG